MKLYAIPSPQMTKQDIQSFLAELIVNHQLHKNSQSYDGLILIFCGHGEDENMLVASDGKQISITQLRSSFDCSAMESLKDLPKIFIIDACRGETAPKAYELTTRSRDIQWGHNDDGFLIIWSTTKGHKVADLSLLSKSFKDVVTSKYKSGYPFKQMLQDIRTDIRNKKCSEWYCIESQDTTDYDIIFQQRKSL
ncbi:subfamily C14A unassigned peptidase (C14 family) [Reticulomyxa filosa]|uniref:Subfamily C14A unassigned peptidase (C14 family) n=1 Tax=Reticulomyxa filosa TaxID=46433 RepID=X6NWU0_RETFI|nr:subfamily C14A unassigned peptidase (C14 family) [Reticulomyxa filosa]|eukprot:ETO30785.1 subfamily C14A unassigned peptidase (C14 family) [Reticulomyxa filosa]